MEAADRFGGHKAECLFGPAWFMLRLGGTKFLLGPTQIGVADIKINIWVRNLFAGVTRTDWDRETGRARQLLGQHIKWNLHIN